MWVWSEATCTLFLFQASSDKTRSSSHGIRTDYASILGTNSEGANIWHEPVIWHVPILFSKIVYIFLPEDLDKNQSKLRCFWFYYFFKVAVNESVLKSFLLLLNTA